MVSNYGRNRRSSDPVHYITNRAIDYGKQFAYNTAKQLAFDAAAAATSKYLGSKMQIDNPPPRASNATPRSALSAGVPMNGGGVYRGPFKRKRMAKTKAKKMLKKKKRSRKVQKPPNIRALGIAVGKEEFGSVDDADTVYIVNPVISDELMINLLVQNLMKKLFKKGLDWACPSAQQEIQYTMGSGTTDPAGLVVTLYGGDSTGTDINYDVFQTYPLVNGDTIETVAQQFYASFYLYSSGNGTAAAQNTYEYYTLSLFAPLRAAGGSTDFNMLKATIDLREEMAYYTGQSTLKIQNRTLNQSGTTTTDVNDAKPLEGYIYDFKGLPNTVQESTGDFKTLSLTVQTKTFGAATLPNNFKEPPSSRLFTNCLRRNKVYLDPGVIKTLTGSFTGKMKLLPLLRRINYRGNASSIHSHTIYPSQMICLEEVINSTDANAVKIGFENSIKLAVCLVHKKKSVRTDVKYTATSITETT